jgi:iron complex outermembrane recepter protein
MSQLVEGNNPSQVYTLPDTTSPGGSSRVLLVSGGNGQLRPEHSRNWSFGLAYKSDETPNASAALSCYHINSHGRIDHFPLTSDVLNNSEYATEVIRNPTYQQRQGACYHSNFAGKQGDCLSLPIDALVDLRTLNASVLTTSGLDLSTSYRWGSVANRFEIGLGATYIIDYSVAPTPSSQKVELRDTISMPN